MKPDSKITIFLPCRAGSERIPRKNIKPFAGVPYGLFEIKINQLLRIPNVDTIIVSTNDQEIIGYVGKNVSNPKIRLDIRPEHLCTSATSTDELIKYVPEIIDSGNVLWTHATSPMCDETVYKDAIATYFAGFDKGFDSLMSVTVLRKFLFRDDFSPVNFDRNVELWPRTQTLEPIYEANSAFFISSIQNYIRLNDRIGQKPLFYELDQVQSFDIDWEDDFRIAELMYARWINTKN